MVCKSCIVLLANEIPKSNRRRAAESSQVSMCGLQLHSCHIHALDVERLQSFGTAVTMHTDERDFVPEL